MGSLSKAFVPFLTAFSLCLPAASGCSDQKAPTPSAPGTASSVAAFDPAGFVEQAKANLEKIRLTMAASRETKIEVLGAEPAKIPGVVVLKLRVTREERSAVRRVLVTEDFDYAIVGAIIPLGQIPRLRVDLENVKVEGAPSRGNPDAEITLVEYSDFQCPYCRVSQAPLDQLLRAYEGKVRLVFKHYPLDIHEWALDAALLAECARKQDPKIFWKLHDFYFGSRSVDLTHQNILQKTQEFVKSDGLDMDAFNACYLEKETIDIIAKDVKEAKAIGVKGTPVLLVNDVFVSGMMNYDILNAILLEEMGLEQAGGGA